MDSISRMSSQRIIRGAREEDRLLRINAAPYDAPADQTSQVSLTASKRLLNYVKDTMSGAVSAIKKHILHQSSVPTLKTIPLTQSVKFQPLPQGIFDGVSSSIQQTISKPEYSSKFSFDSMSPQLSKKPSLLSVVDFYKDVSTEKVRETMQSQNSHSYTQSPKCQTRPVPVYSTKNQAIEESRRQKEKNGLNKYNKRELHSILNHKEKPSKGNKKVSFVPPVPDLRRSQSSVIKYSSSDEEDSASFYDKPRKQIFIDSNVVLKKEPTIQFSLIKAKKLKPNPFHKKRLAEKVSRISEKGYHKQFKGEFDGKFNVENSFGSDHLIHDSKVETDSDDSGVHGESRNFSIYKNMGNHQKKNRRDHFDSSSDKEEQIHSVASSQKAESPKLDTIEEDESILEQESQDPIKPTRKISEEVTKPVSPVISQAAAPKASLFSGSLGAKTETTQPKSLLSTISEQPKEEKKTEAKSLFSGFNNKPAVEVAPEVKPVVESKPIETAAPVQQPTQGFLGGSSLFGKGNIGGESTTTTQALQKPSLLFGQKEEAPKAAEPVEQPKIADPELSKKLDVSEEAMKDPIFSSIRNPVQSQQFSNNPFLARVDSFVNPFTQQTTTINQTENKENNAPVMNTNPMPASGGGILELFSSKSTNQGENAAQKKELVGVGGTISLFSQASESGNTEQKGLFGNLSGGVFAQKSLDRQNSLFGGDNNNSSGLGGGQNSMFGGNINSSNNTSSLFGGNNNNNNNNNGMSFGNNNNNNSGNSLFGGNNNGMGGGSSSLFGGASNNTGSGMGSMFGGNSMQQPDLSSNPFTASFAGGSSMGGGMGGGSYGSSGGNSFGSGQKRKGQKERAF